MNREEAIELLPVLEAFIAGETIQYQHRNMINPEWDDWEGEYPALHDSSLRWRVKPEKQRPWAVIYKNDDKAALFDEESEARSYVEGRNDVDACIRIEYTPGDGMGEDND